MKIFIVSMSRLNMVTAIKLAGQPDRLAGLSYLGSNFPHLTTWVGRELLSPVMMWCNSGLEISWSREPMGHLNSSAVPLNLCRKPKYLPVSIHNTFKMQLGSLEKKVNFEPQSVKLEICMYDVTQPSLQHPHSLKKSTTVIDIQIT